MFLMRPSCQSQWCLMRRSTHFGPQVVVKLDTCVRQNHGRYITVQPVDSDRKPEESGRFWQLVFVEHVEHAEQTSSALTE